MLEDEEKAILNLWKLNEKKRFGEIKHGLSKKLKYRYDVKQNPQNILRKNLYSKNL